MTKRTGYERMRAGEPYEAPDWDLIAMQIEAGKALARFNATIDIAERMAMLKEMLGSFGRGFVTSPVRWEYGKHIHLGDAVFINFDCIFLDGADIRIGDGTAIAPRVQFLTAGHPVDPVERTRFDETTLERIGAYCINKPITVGRDCWIGAGAIILGGVTIGDGTTIGAGSVVTRDIPAGVVAAGNPCRVLRPAAAGARAAAA
ncbi:MAG TPA: sugar O-acetyltransferase [Alphaproteobacteria bacterium]|nr:sugar O-acetyltransferase [Alphaproteobacteria bacterium]